MLLFRAHTLPSGLRVRVRRLLRYDPRARAVVCATAWVDGAERLVGFAAAEPGDELALLADEARAPGVTEVLRTDLREHLTRVA